MQPLLDTTMENLTSAFSVDAATKFLKDINELSLE